MSIEQKEFDGHVAVSISEREVRVWVCKVETGENIFRFKATGKVYHGVQDITSIGPTPEDYEVAVKARAKLAKLKQWSEGLQGRPYSPGNTARDLQRKLLEELLGIKED